MAQVTLPDGRTLSTGGEEGEVDPVDVDRLAGRMFAGATQTPGQLPPDVLAAHERQAHRQETMTGGALSSIPFNVFLPPELERSVEQWREALQVAQDADAAVTVAEEQLRGARAAAVDARTADDNAELPDFEALRRVVDEAQINAEAKLRLAATATSRLRVQVRSHYRAWRGYIVSEFRGADERVAAAIAQLQHAVSVRDDMIGAVVDLDAAVGADMQPMTTGDGSPSRHELQVGARESLNGQQQHRARALTEYVNRLAAPSTLEWTP